MNEKFTRINSMLVAGLEHSGPYEQIGSLFGKLGEICARSNLFTPNSRVLALYYDDPSSVSSDKLRSVAAITIDENANIPDSLSQITIEGGEYAVGIHKGPYENLDNTYMQIGKWIQEQEKVPRNEPCFEIYLNDPSETSPDDLMTEVYVPV